MGSFQKSPLQKACWGCDCLIKSIRLSFYGRSELEPDSLAMRVGELTDELPSRSPGWALGLLILGNIKKKKKRKKMAAAYKHQGFTYN